MKAQKIASGAVHAVPTDLRDTLTANPKALAVWERITPLARNEWICWIISAKKSDTRARRIERTCAQLIEDKHRPCCWAGCVHRE